MSMSRTYLLATALLCSTLVAPALSDPKNGLGASVGLGKPIAESDIKAWDITILPDGTNLPQGSGTASQGARIFAEKCAACHGEGAKGGTNPALITDLPLAGYGIEANKTIKNFWANATTIFDYVRRAMPWPTPRTLTDDEVYALVAYILVGNKIIDEGAVMDAKSLPRVKMPNRDNFIIKFPDRI
jgi:S-disulfanyl-L-cysteine oxidoreductase SoxD